MVHYKHHRQSMVTVVKNLISYTVFLISSLFSTTKRWELREKKNKEWNQNIALIGIWLFGSHNLGHDI